MSRLGKEWEVKLDLLQSIARSQAALARMLESVADVAEGSESAAAALREHARVLTNLQGALLGAVAGTSWRPPVAGKPARPWLARSVSPLWAATMTEEREVIPVEA
ncbi:hypothetical protein J19TS2_06050 [Cohnella xylanilytica]|uniref:Uncharacterized protein n=1 Tax=Cohnella xylanilytica TaxID=557555 RepID=A0A841U0U2_9BACL|nr:hypothetical protein [Cohnella xylanilytica]MBB6694146.1 hypothetical protein [Cohnella xylanilytica]GIO11050.1 hypothetical protein J19TS2_06050 [Cohnella xylanilytica]